MPLNKKIILIFAVIALLLIAGCKGRTGTKGSITGVDIRSGVKGIAMDFVKGSPPENVFEDDVFPIAIRLENKGAFNIEEEKGILVFGFEKQYVEATKEGDGEKQKFKIEGKSVFNPDGDTEFITIDAKVKKIGSQSESRASTILATACYRYETLLGTSACIDADIYGAEVRKKACTIKDLSFGNGQGAPVAITKIETRMLPQEDDNRIKPQFLIHVENEGNGEVIRPGKYENACTSGALEYEDLNRMNIKALLSGEELDCSLGLDEEPENIIRLRDKKDIVRCTLEEGIEKSEGAYTAQLKVELDYGYSFTISKDITIEKVLKY
ncbi:MAG: hypothetical protein QF436_02660 [Candidatus Woesearchaeota archaeon]|jgi:hypothetical protein|nr:hypothetical protein [Candidatus Woesearchaeota archaeon]MDP7622993.1 hypothetical protein [Candidatus Woesearchaeota archaeon]HJN56376.1 hypothetical protein [Candidatus Woesearchaeota archaeon]|tara:strand:- start:5226 stop:6200 length:975 start_codon:yes stop_codon:yes gene_type:complete